MEYICIGNGVTELVMNMKNFLATELVDECIYLDFTNCVIRCSYINKEEARGSFLSFKNYLIEEGLKCISCQEYDCDMRSK